MFDKSKKDEPELQHIVVTRLEDGQNVVSLPLPQRTMISSVLLGALTDGMIETIITFRFANRQARYRVIDAGYYVTTLICELIQESEGRLPPLIEPDPETMLKVKRFNL